MTRRCGPACRSAGSTYPELYALVRGPSVDDDKAREWVRTQFVYLEGRKLVRREAHPYHDGEHVVRVLRDDGSDEFLDDRDGSRRDHVGASRVDFKKPTLITGKQRLQKAGFIEADTITRNPPDGRTFARGGSRNTYLNRFETKATAILAGHGITAILVPA